MPDDNPGTILASDFNRCLHNMSDAAWVAMLKSMSDETLGFFHLWLLAEGGKNMYGRWWTNAAQSAMNEIRRREREGSRRG